MGAALPFVAAASIGASALGQIASSQAQSASAKYNSQIAANNAQIATQNATFAGQEGEGQAAQSQARTRATEGAILATQGAAGIDVNKGSAVDVRASEAQKGMLDAMTIRSNAARKAYGFQTEAASDRAQSELDREQAHNDKTAGYIGAATSVLGGVAGGAQKGAFDSWLGGNSVLPTDPDADMQTGSGVTIK